MSLTACLKKASTYLPTSDKNDILEKAREYRQQGLTPAAAAVRAVTDQLAQVQAELDAAEQAEPASNNITESKARDTTDTPEFKRFFDGSQVVTEDGKPLQMYTGTSKDVDFSSFKAPKNGIWFTSDPKSASDYAVENDSMDLKTDDYRTFTKVNTASRVIPVYLSIKNGATLDEADSQKMRNADNYKRAQGQIFDKLKAQGYDGVNLGGGTWVAFDGKQVKSSVGNNGDFDPSKSNITQSPARPEFYSQLERAIEGVPDRLATMAAPQWKLWLDANAGKLGVKKDEIEFSGVKDYLTLRGKDKVTREEIAGYLGENGVKVKEVVLGVGGARDGYRVAQAEDGSGFDVIAPDGENVENFASRTEAESWAEGLDKDTGNDGGTKYANYTVPGGTNYREVLITLPSKNPDVPNIVLHPKYAGQFALQFPSGEYVTSSDGGATTERTTNVDKASNWETKEYAQYGIKAHDKRKDVYKSSHFDQANILAHLRVDDRTDADGKKVFFINEVQSDWGQDGKKKGFNVSVPIQVKPGEHAQTMASIRKAAAKHMMDTANLSELEATRVASTLPESTAARMVGREEEYDSLRSRAEQDMQNEQSRRGNPSGIPSAPFVQKTEAWVGLAIKHAIMHAASNGYDKVAFINGEQAAGLYDLSKQVSLIEYAVTGDQNYKLIITDTNDNKLPVPSSLDAEGVESHVGKEIAQKIIDTATSKYQEISGNGLKVGGEGMKTFYDTLVPQVANDVLKKLGGGKVEDMPLVSGLGITKSFGGWQVVDAKNQSASDKIFKDQQSAWKWIASNAPSPMQKSFDITDAMREKVSAGLPLFSPARDINDSVTNPKDVVGNQGGRSADDITPSAANKNALLTKAEFDSALAFVKEVESLAEKHGAVYVRWSASEKHDLSVDAKSRDYGSGEIHAGLSSQKIDADMHPVTIASRIAEYNFMRGFSNIKGAYPRIYTADEVGTDSDNAVSITNLKKVIDVPKSFVAAIDKKFHDAYDYKDSLETWGKRGNDEMVSKYTKKLSSVLENEPTAPDSGGASKSQTDTPAFKKWFGDSKVVDAQGQPLVVYHGTEAPFQEFKTARGAWFISNATESAEYGSRKIDAYLSIQNPYTGTHSQNARLGAERMMQLAQEKGHDGIHLPVDLDFANENVYTEAEHDVWIAFNPNQIKSATGNNGAFDPASNNITESKIREQNLIDGYKVSDFLDSAKQINWWDKTVGTPYHLAQKSPEFKRVFDSIQNFIGDVSRYANRAADLAPTMLPKLENAKDVFKSPLSAEDVNALAGPIFEGTLSYTRDKDGNPVLTDDVGLAGVVWRDEELTQIFNLKPAQIKMYREFRKATNKSINDLATSDMIKYAGKDGAGVRDAMLNAPNTKQAALLLEDHLATLASQNPDRADVLQNTARVIKLKAGEAQGLIAKGYAPLTRYGDHTLYVTRGEGENLEQIFFGMYENEREANKASRAMAVEYPDATIKVGTMSKEAHKQFQGITPETMALLGDALGLEEDSDSPRSQMFQEMLKLSKSTRSAMKRLIERKGVDGYSDDAGRVLAGFVYSNARQSSQNLNSGEIAKSAHDIPKEMGDLKDHAIKLVEYAQNPQEEAPAMRGLLFAQFIGGSIASSMVNATQSVAVTWPTLSQHFGIGRSGAALTSAITTVKNGAGSDTDLAAAMKRAQDEGITDPLETHQLMGQAQGRGSLKSGDGTKLGDTLAKMSNGMAKVQLIWGKAFGLAEVLNRKLAFVAAYKLAREKGMPDPYAFAKKIVSDSQFVLNKGSNPVWARGAVGATLFTFKKYGVFYLENLARMYGNGPEGKKAFALSLAIMFVLAGAGGFPFADDLDDVIDGFAQRILNKSFSSKQAKKEFFSKILGDAGAEFVMTGVSGLPGVPIDVSGRLGMSNLIPGTGVLVKKVDHSRDVMEVFGAAGAFASRIITGGGQLAQGDVGGAVENFVPIAIANMIKAKSMADLGYYKDLKNRKVIDTTMTEAVLKAIGFQPSSVKNVQDATMVQQGLIALNKIRETEIADLWTRGRVERKPELIADAKQQLVDWNSDNPYSPIKIDGSQINSRVKLANMSKAQRIERSAPKEIRKDVKEHLARELNRE